MPILGSLLAWLLIVALAIANGLLRESVLVPALGRTGGLMLSGVILSLLVALVAYVFVRARRGLSFSQGWLVGTFWLCLTLLLEFGFGLYVQQRTWGELTEAYRFQDGNIWPIVLVVTFLAPPVAAWVRGRQEHDARQS